MCLFTYWVRLFISIILLSGSSTPEVASFGKALLGGTLTTTIMFWTTIVQMGRLIVPGICWLTVQNMGEATLSPGTCTRPGLRDMDTYIDCYSRIRKCCYHDNCDTPRFQRFSRNVFGGLMLKVALMIGQMANLLQSVAPRDMIV